MKADLPATRTIGQGHQREGSSRFSGAASFSRCITNKTETKIKKLQENRMFFQIILD